jgi:hypothetical protein
LNNPLGLLVVSGACFGATLQTKGSAIGGAAEGEVREYVFKYVMTFSKALAYCIYPKA